MLYAVPVGSTIANGSIEKLDIAAAEKMPGSCGGAPPAEYRPTFRIAPDQTFSTIMDEKRPPLEDDIIRYYGQLSRWRWPKLSSRRRRLRPRLR